MRFYNAVLESIVLPIGDWILGTRYMSTIKAWRRIQKGSAEEIDELQRQKLARILQHAARNIPFYSGLDADKPLLQNFPILTKQVIRENMDRLLWHPERKDKLISERSSGSSGVQGQVYMTREEQSQIQAVQTIMWEWSGYRIGDPILQTGMTLNRGVVKRLKDFLFRTHYVSAFGLDESDVEGVLRTVPSGGSWFLGGYASSLHVYANVAQKKGLNNIRFAGVISWGDKMFSHYRAGIERIFRTKVFDTYGTTEGFMVAAQKDLDYYYILSPNVYLEIVDHDGRPVPDGQMGFVLVTSLDSFEMPLIRYYLGDLAIKLPRENYPPNRDLNFPLLERIIGRDTDIVRTPAGKSMIVHFFTGIFEHVEEIKQFRIIQNELSSMVIEYVRREGFRPHILEDVRRKILHHLNEDFVMTFREVESISPSPSGKPQIIISTLPKEL